jgi:RNA polymerase sigma-70 factor (ECF subfamily)
MTIDKILLEAKNGSETAFYRIYETYRERIYRLACRYVRNREDAEDIMQETFVKTFKNLNRLKKVNETSFTSWIQTICVNSSLNALRRQKRRNMGGMKTLSNLMPEPESSSPSPEQTAQIRDHLSLIQKSFEKLPPKQKLIFDMRYYQHHDIKDIASLLQCSESNVKTQLMRSLNKLKNELNPIWRE